MSQYEMLQAYCEKKLQEPKVKAKWSDYNSSTKTLASMHNTTTIRNTLQLQIALQESLASRQTWREWFYGNTQRIEWHKAIANEYRSILNNFDKFTENDYLDFAKVVNMFMEAGLFDLQYAPKVVFE